MHDYAHGKINLSSAGELQIDLKTFIGRCIYFVISMYIFFILRHETFAQWTFALFNADAEIYCYVLGLMQEYQTFWYSYVIFSIRQTKAFTYTH